jgi:hypothetical protein
VKIVIPERRKSGENSNQTWNSARIEHLAASSSAGTAFSAEKQRSAMSRQMIDRL